MLTTFKNPHQLGSFSNILTAHPVLSTTHYAICVNNQYLKSPETGVALTADPALWLYEKYPAVFEGLDTLDVNASGIKSYREYTFIPVIHPSTLADYERQTEQPTCQFCGSPMDVEPLSQELLCLNGECKGPEIVPASQSTLADYERQTVLDDTDGLGALADLWEATR